MNAAIIDLAARRRWRHHPSPREAAEYQEKIVDTYQAEGREMADLAHPIVEPFRVCEPELEQHIKGAFIRWQMDEIKKLHAHDPLGDVGAGLAIAVMVASFTERLAELQYGFDPDGGEAA